MKLKREAEEGQLKQPETPDKNESVESSLLSSSAPSEYSPETPATLTPNPSKKRKVAIKSSAFSSDTEDDIPLSQLKTSHQVRMANHARRVAAKKIRPTKSW